MINWLGLSMEAHMPTAELPASQSLGTPPMNLVATGCALTSALVGLFVLCYLAEFVWPTSGLAHGWVNLFVTDPSNVARTLIEGIVGSVAGAWVATALFVPVYNRLVAR